LRVAGKVARIELSGFGHPAPVTPPPQSDVLYED
jgi:hypothetical protein